MNPLLALNQCGQSVWLDNISRQLIGRVCQVVEKSERVMIRL
jgi:hypothetical protein